MGKESMCLNFAEQLEKWMAETRSQRIDWSNFIDICILKSEEILASKKKNLIWSLSHLSKASSSLTLFKPWRVKSKVPAGGKSGSLVMDFNKGMSQALF